MPSRERVRAFVATVEAGRFVEAIETYYADDASMQENLAPPRRGKAALVSHERAVLAAHTTARALPGSLWLIEGERVAIRWVFEMVRPGGAVMRLDEVALQLWRDDLIIEERFYYDPGHMKRT